MWKVRWTYNLQAFRPITFSYNFLFSTKIVFLGCFCDWHLGIAMLAAGITLLLAEPTRTLCQAIPCHEGQTGAIVVKLRHMREFYNFNLLWTIFFPATFLQNLIVDLPATSLRSMLHMLKKKKKSLKIFLKTSLGMNSNGLYCLQDKAQITSQALGEQTLTHLSCPFPHHFPLWILHSAIGIFELFLKVFQNFASHMLIPPPRMVFMTYSSGKLWLTLQDYGQDFLSITSQTTNSG